jgi:hypothetical protein
MIRSTKSNVKALPKRLCISIGGHFGPCYSVTLKKGRLTYTYLQSRDSYLQELGPQPQREEIQPSAKQWQNFRSTLNRLNVWCWQGDYPNSAMVCDGTGWSADIAYSDQSLVSNLIIHLPGGSAEAAESLVHTSVLSLETFGSLCRTRLCQRRPCLPAQLTK